MKLPIKCYSVDHEGDSFYDADDKRLDSEEILAVLNAQRAEVAPTLIPLYVEEESGGWRVCDKPDNRNGVAFCIIRRNRDDAINEMIEYKRCHVNKSPSKEGK